MVSDKRRMRNKESNKDYFCLILTSTDINLPLFELF